MTRKMRNDLKTIAVGFVFLPVAMMLAAYTVSNLWGRFVVPGLGVAPLSKLHAYGIALLVSYVVPHPRDKDEVETWWAGPVRILTKTGIVLLWAAIAEWVLS